MASDPGGQLKIHQQINNLLKERQSMLLDQVDILGSQARMAKEVCNGLDCKNLDGMEDRLNGVQRGLEGVRDRTDTMNEGLRQGQEEAGKLADKFVDIKKAAKLGAIAGFTTGIVGGFKSVISTVKNTISIVKGFIGTLFNVGVAILSIPFKIMGGLVDMAQQSAGAGNALREAMEAVRETFGDLASNEGKALINGMKDVRKQAGNLAGTGLSMGKVFGYGPEGAAEALKQLSEVAESAGNGFSLIKDELEDNATAFLMYKKGLGLTAEQLGNIGANAVVTGTTMKEQMRKFGQAAINAGKAHGYSSKVIGKGMGKLVEDFANFGRMAPKTLANITVFTKKLGIEIKSLTGLIDGFDNFEDAAKSASRLNQVFGMQIDAMKMMREQDPAKRLQMQQEAFRKTGRSVETMERAELKLFAASVKMSEQDAYRAFSQKGLSQSYDDIMKKTDKQSKKELTQTQVLKELSKNIKRLVKMGSRQFTGFLDAFLKGIGSGIKRSAAFRKLMININKSLNIVFRSGQQVGNMFVNIFPGVKKVLGGLADIFDPKSMSKLMGGVVKAFKKLFKTLQYDPDAGFDTFMDSIGSLFGRFFASKGPAVQAIMDGGKRMIRALTGLAGQIIKYAGPKIVEAMGVLADFIKNPEALKNAGGAGGFAYEMLEPILESFQEVGPALGDAFLNLMKAAWEHAKKPIMDLIGHYVTFLFAKFMIHVVASTIKGAASAAIGAYITKIVSGVSGMSGDGKGVPGTKTLSKQMAELADVNLTDIAKASAVIAVMGATFLVAMAGVAVAVAKIISFADTKELIKGMAAVAVMTGSCVAIGAEAFFLSKVKKKDLLVGGLVTGAIGYLLMKMMEHIIPILKGFSEVSAASVLKFQTVLVTMIGATIAVGLAAFGLGKLAFLSKGVGALVILAGIAALGLIGMAVAKGTKEFIEYFSDVTPENLEKGRIAAEVQFKVVKSLATAAMTALVIGGPALFGALARAFGGKGPIERGIDALERLAGIMSDKLPPIITNMRKAIEGRNGDVKKTKNAIETIGAIMKAIKPMADVAMKMGEVVSAIYAAESKYGRVDPSKADAAMKNVTNTVKLILQESKTFIEDITGMMGQFSNEKVEKLKNVAPLLESVGTLVKSLTSPLQTFIDGSKKSIPVLQTAAKEGSKFAFGFLSYKGGGEAAQYGTGTSRADMGLVRQALSALGDNFATMLSGIGDGLAHMIKALNETPMDVGDAAELKRKMSVIDPMVKTLSVFIDVANKSFGIIAGMTASWKNKDMTNHKIGTGLKNIAKLFFGDLGEIGSQTSKIRDFSQGDRRGLVGLLSALVFQVTRFDLVSTTEMEQAETKAKLMETVAGVAQVTVGLITSILSAFDIKKYDFSKMTPEDTTKLFSNIGTVLDAVGPKLGTMMGKILDAVDTLGDVPGTGKGGIQKVRRVAKKAKDVKAIMGAIEPILGLLSGFGAMHNKMQGKVKEVTKLSDNTTEKVFGQHSRERFHQGLKSKTAREMTKTTETVTEGHSKGVVGLVTDMLDALVGKGEDEGALKRIMSRVDGVLKMDMFKDTKSLLTKTSALKQVFDGLFSLISVFKMAGKDVKTAGGGTKSGLDVMKEGMVNLDKMLNLTGATGDLLLPGIMKQLKGPILTSMGTKAQAESLAARMAQYKLVFTNLSNAMAEVPDQLLQPEYVTTLYNSLLDLDNAFAAAKRINAVVAGPFKGGKLQVTHKAQGVTANIKVYLSADQVAQKVSEVKSIPGGTNKGKSFALNV